MQSTVESLASRATQEVGAAGSAWEQQPTEYPDAMGIPDHIEISRGGFLVLEKSRTGDIVLSDAPTASYEDDLVALLHKSHDMHLGAPWTEWASPTSGSYLLRLAQHDSAQEWQGLWVPYEEHERSKGQRLVTYYLPKATELTPEQVQAGHNLIDIFRSQRTARLAEELAETQARLTS